MNAHRKWKSESDDAETTLFSQDVLLAGFGAVAFMFMLLLTLINKPGLKEASSASLPGNIIIESYWDQVNPGTGKCFDVDVDLWVMGPDKQPIGYSNKGGKYYDLLRDDLGCRSKDDPVNYEITTSRGVIPGFHCVNLHLYANRAAVLPVKVKLTVKVVQGNPGESATKGGSDPVIVSDVLLKSEGEERNAFCFALDESGTYDPKQTITSQFVRLRSPKG